MLNALSFKLDIRVRQCALKLQDKPLHVLCLASLYSKARDSKAQESNVDDINHGIAFTGLVSYIEDMRMDNRLAPVLKLTDLVNLYIPGWSN